MLALWDGQAWRFFSPAEGWRGLVLDEGIELVWQGGAWAAPARMGVNAAPDETNRLAVSANATLLTHEGGGHQLKINKAESGATASLLFQTGFAGRAEMGIAGQDDFSIKVTADGVNWTELPDTPWAPRHAASPFVYDDALWMVAGNNMFPDVWKLVRK